MCPSDKNTPEENSRPAPVAVQHARILLVCAPGSTAGEAARTLTLAGYAVEQASDVSAARPLPDLALVVGPLPTAGGGDGSFAAARALKSLADSTYLPVLVAAPLDEDKISDETGADDLLPLPIAPAGLLRRVGALLHLKRLYQALADSAQETAATCEDAQKQAARLQAVFTQSPPALLLVSEGRILEANLCALRLTGGEPEDLIGQPLACLSPPDGDDNWAVAAQHSGADFHREDAALVTLAGEHVAVRVQAVTAAGSSGAGDALRVVTLTDLRPFQARIAEARAAAASDMANAFSREINNPLFVISSNAEMLQSALLEQDSSLRAKLARIADASRRIALATGRLSLPPSHSE